MIIEDYYGFPSHRQNTTGFGRQRGSQRTERSPNIGSRQMKSPKYRTLKRTELSNQKLHSKGSVKQKLTHAQPIYRQQTNHYDQSSAAINLPALDQSSRNRQQIETMAKKYDNYMRADSIQFTNGDINRTNRSVYTNQVRFRPQSRPTQHYDNCNQTRHHPRQQSQQYYSRHYRSASRGKNTELLQHFQRIPQGNAIDRANQNISSRSKDSKYKKSKSLTNKIKKQYLMHTYYHADKYKISNYNQDGYLTQRQEELLMIIEDKARKAFQRAAYETQNQQRPAQKRPSRPKKFQIQESSRIQHKNSDILSDLRNQNASHPRHQNSPVRKISDKHQKYHEERVIDVSIDPRKAEHHYDDYQLKPGAKGSHQVLSNPSISNFVEEKPAVNEKKNVFNNFAKDEDDSLLQFRPSKPRQEQKQPSKQPSKQPLKKLSQISDYKSIDMVQINSNCKINDKQQIKQKQKIQNGNSDDNRSLGINTIRSFELKKKISTSSHKQSHLSASSSSGLSHSQTNSQLYSQSNNHSRQVSSQKVSKSGSNIQKSKANHKDFNKNKLRSSQSLSHDLSESLHNDLSKAAQHITGSKHEGDQKTVKNPLFQSDRLGSSKKQSIMNESSEKKIKIKRLKKADTNSVSESSETSKKLQGIQILGYQSFPKFEILQGVQIKVSPSAVSGQLSMNKQNRPMSRIDEVAEKNASQQNSRFNQKDSGVKSKHNFSPSNLAHSRSVHSVGNRSRLSRQRSQRHIGEASDLQYDVFNEIRQFIEEQQYEYHQPRKDKQVLELISQEFGELLNKIEQHLYLLNCIAELILIVPDVYEFETIYAQEKEWIFLSIFLTLKKYSHERDKVVAALSGGKNCFLLLGWIIQDSLLKKYLQRVEVKAILDNLMECNVKLNKILNNFHNFMIKFKKLPSNQSFINLRPFNNSQELPVLLNEFDKEIDNLLKKRVEQFNNGQIPVDDEQQYEMLTLVNERIFKMMEVGFVLSNLAGKEVKSYEKDEELYRVQQKFKDYILDNHQLFKHMIRSFK